MRKAYSLQYKIRAKRTCSHVHGHKDFRALIRPWDSRSGGSMKLKQQ